MLRARLCGILALGLAFAVLAGCGGPKQAKTPEEAVKMLLAAATAGDAKAADDLIAWNTLAKQANPDWDSIPASQRKLIVDKEKELNASVVSTFLANLSGASVLQASVQGDQALVAINTAAGEASLQAVNTDKGWKVIMPNAQL